MASDYRSVREYLEVEYLPYVLQIGVPYSIWHKTNPRIWKSFAEGYRRKNEADEQFIDNMMFVMGMYVQEALASTVGNMFKDKGSVSYRYPEMPYHQMQKIKNDNKESQEEVAVLEAKRRIRMLEAMGLPESPC